MSPEHALRLTREAREILRANDRGGYTVPAQGLYPFQWDWDAAVTALGWITFDEARAWDEFRWLLKGQWRGGANDGFIPHIVFHRRADSYFPGPQEWGLLHLTPPTSSISQPPLHATMLRWMWQRATDRSLARERLREILPAIARHHLWWYEARDPMRTGLVVTVHPWETGRDNAPAWDEALARVPAATRPYRRRDTDHVAADQRPTQDFYDRVVYLMDFNREANFDPGVIVRDSPFRVVDVGIVCMLHRATLDLLALAHELAVVIEAAPLALALDRTQAAIGSLWSDSQFMYVSRDLVSGDLIERPVFAGFLSWYAGVGGGSRAAAQARTLERWLHAAPYGVPSARPGSDGFEPKRYWRGPVWQHMNLLIEAGLRETGETLLADRIRESSMALFGQSGFHEYCNPLTGVGLGGDRFSWTAATWLFRSAPQIRERVR